MELEGTESFVNAEKIPKKALSKKGINELSGNLFSSNTGILDSKAFSVFSDDLQRAETLEEQIRLITVLNKTSPDLISRFVNYKGMEQVVDLLSKAGQKASEKSELIEKIITFLNKIPLTSEILEKTKVHMVVEAIKKNIEMPEDICSKVFRLLAKWKKPIEDWTREHKKDENIPPKQESSNMDSRPEGNSDGSRFHRNANNHFNRNAIKRTYDRNRDRPYTKYDGRGPRNFDSHRKPRMYEDRPYRRNDSSSRYHNNNHYRRRGNYSPENRGPKKTLKWADDSNLCTVKYFKFNDEPTAPGVSEEEVTQIRQKMMDEENGTSFQSSEDYKHKESLMESQSMKQIKDSEKEVQEKLHQMKETMAWVQPKKIKLGADNMYMQCVGKESEEAAVQQKRIANKLPAFYLKEYQIPEQPAYDEPEESANADEWETNIIPLHNVNERGDPTELMHMIEEIIQHKDEEEKEEASAEEEGSSPSEEGSPVEGEGAPEKKEDSKIEEENKDENKEEEEKKPVEVKKPLKGILKKSREELAKIRAEERRQREEERREREAKRRAEEAKLEAMLKGVVEGTVSLENQDELLEALKNTRNSKNALENIKLLLEVKKMQNSQQGQATQPPQLNQLSELINSDKKLDQHFSHNNHGPQDQYYGSQPTKRVKLNPELSNPRREERNHFNNDLTFSPPERHLSSKPTNFQNDRPYNPQKFSNQLDQEYISTEESSAENQNKKAPMHKPHNYKTVPCRLFHSSKGCQFGDDCHYIHDLNYAGRETPNMQKYIRPFNSVNKNIPPNFKSAPQFGDSFNNDMDIEPQPFNGNNNTNYSAHHKPQRAAFSRGESAMNSMNNLSPEGKLFRENFNHQPQRQNLQQNAYPSSFNSQQQQNRQPNRVQNQQFTPQSFRPQRDTSFEFDDFSDSRTNMKDFSKVDAPFNRIRPQHSFQQQQQPFNAPQQLRTYNASKASMNVPPNPYIINSQLNEKPISTMKNYGNNNMYKQTQQSRGASYEPTDTRRMSNSGNPLYPQRMQGTEQRAYPSQSQFRQNNSQMGGGFGNMRNMHDNRMYQDVRF